jgi:hypothetical protein
MSYKNLEVAQEATWDPDLVLMLVQRMSGLQVLRTIRIELQLQRTVNVLDQRNPGICVTTLHWEVRRCQDSQRHLVG